MIALRSHLAASVLVFACAAAPLAAQPAPTPTPTPPPGAGTAPPAAGTTPATAPVKATGYFHYDELLAPPEEETVVLHTGPTPELHVVRRGDTLWDISWYYFSDPWQWPKVWSFNGQITNPHWIYPGDLVRLLPKGFLVVAPSTEPDPRSRMTSWCSTTWLNAASASVDAVTVYPAVVKAGAIGPPLVAAADRTRMVLAGTEPPTMTGVTERIQPSTSPPGRPC